VSISEGVTVVGNHWYVRKGLARSCWSRTVTFLRTKAAENDPEAFPNSDKFHHHRQFLSEGDGISCISAGTALVADRICAEMHVANMSVFDLTRCSWLLGKGAGG
jgi:hypothetical protein